MSRAKKGATSEGRVPAQNEAAESPSSMEQLLKTMEKIQESMDKTFQGLEEGQKKLSGSIEALESNQRSHAGNTGPHERKSGEQDATEVGGLTPFEQQSRLVASSSYEPLQLFKNRAAAAATAATDIPSFTALLSPRTFSGWQTVPTCSFRGWRAGTPTPADCRN